MKNVAPWLKFIFGLANIRTQYEEIKANEESRKVSTVLGKKAIIYCIMFVLFVVAAGFLGYWGFGYVETIAFLFGIVLIVLAVVFAAYSLTFLVFALSCSIKQIKLNRRPIGIFALILTLVLVIATGVTIAIIFNKVK